MKREGRKFYLFYPSFDKGISYYWPDKDGGFKNLFLEKREELSTYLLENCKKYLKEFEFFTNMPPYPYIQKGEKGFIFHIGDGGRWIEFEDTMNQFVAGHNLDAWIGNAVAMNLGSDLLERLDQTLLAPRVRKEAKRYNLEYPIPAGEGLITSDSFTEKNLSRIYEVAGLSGDVKISRNNGMQKIENQNGSVIIENQMCIGRGFERWDIPKASWVISKIMTFYEM